MLSELFPDDLTIEKEQQEQPVIDLKEKYSKSTSIFESFLKASSLGDISAIYRNRPCFTSQKRSLLVKPATDVFVELPSSRNAVYHYTGLLIHETVHLWFNKKENVQSIPSTTSVREASMKLLDFYIKFFKESPTTCGLDLILGWMCELSAELASKNAGRPAMALAQQHEEILNMLKSNEVVAKMLTLMELVVTKLLAEDPTVCLNTLFESSRHGAHFGWIWLYLATLFQGDILTHLLQSGAEQFKTYVTEVSSRKSMQTGGPAVLNIIQTEYEHKFCAVSDVFNFLMRKRNPELQEAVSQLIQDSLDGKHDKPNSKSLGFAFFFKLVTCSLKTLQLIMHNNSHLITPFNAIRAIRQVQSVDQSIILPTATYTEFIRQVVEDVDPVTHGIIFEMVVELVYNPNVFDGEDLLELAESNMKLGQECFPILDVMMNRIVRICHTTGPTKCASQHPAISAFSSGEKLQFIIDSIARHMDKSSSIVRHLHAISIANGEMKAAEIALRFLLTISHQESHYMYVLMAFVKATCPFFPNMLNFMYNEFSSLKTLIEQSLEDTDNIKLHMNLLHNFRTLLEWELTSPANQNHFQYYKVYPKEHIGVVLNLILVDTCKIVADLHQKGDKNKMASVVRMVRALFESVKESNSPMKGIQRTFLISLSNWYKLIAQLSILLKYSLYLVGSEFSEGISVFEELRTTILSFLHNGHIDRMLSPFTCIFIQIFVTSCFVDSKELFHEEFSDSMESLIDESGLNKLLDMAQLEDGPSVIEGLRNLKMKDSALDMLHTGQLKRRRNNGIQPDHQDFGGPSEDAKQRIFVLLDAISDMCCHGNIEIQLAYSKQLALALLNGVAKDSLNSDMRFDDWDIENEFIQSYSRHVEIDRIINQSNLCEGIVRILSESRSFAFCIPIMKARLAVIINEAAKYSDKRSCPEHLRIKLHHWIMLSHRGGILPTRFVHICELEKLASAHETYLMLLEVWRFFSLRAMSLDTIEMYHRDLRGGNVDEGYPNEEETMEKINLTTFRLIIQNHLPDAFPLFPKFFPNEYDFLKLSKIE